MRRVLRHGRVELALHQKSSGRRDAPRLLLLHGLHGSSDDWGDEILTWPGEIVALDFSGHGGSDWLPGRGYTPEGFAAEADAVLAHFGDAGKMHVAGAGIGAYVALLLAGARPRQVAASLLLAGEGLAGGGSLPSALDPKAHDVWLAATGARPRGPREPSPDPLVGRCEHDIRPLYYAEAFARDAGPLLVSQTALAEGARGANEAAGAEGATPAWLAAAFESGNAAAVPDNRAEALCRLATL